MRGDEEAGDVALVLQPWLAGQDLAGGSPEVSRQSPDHPEARHEGIELHRRPKVLGLASAVPQGLSV